MSLEVESTTNSGLAFAAYLMNKSAISIFDAEDLACLVGWASCYVSTQFGVFALTTFEAHISNEKSVICVSRADKQVCCFKSAQITHVSAWMQSHFSSHQGAKEELLWNMILSKLARFSNCVQSWAKSPYLFQVCAF